MARIGAKAPNLQVSTWVQGRPTNIDKEKGNVIVVEVFQVNCPGCFMYGLPEAIDLYEKYHDKGVTVLGMATAFEDYDKNTLENLQKLLTTGEVIGETHKALAQYGQLKNGGKLPYKIPFPVAMDLLKKETGELTESKVMDFIEANVPDFKSYSEKDRQVLIARVKEYLKHKEYSAKTFEEYAMRGTPTSLVIDKKGNLRHNLFGATGYLENVVQELLSE
ncbi:MAG: TlpA disulfide reductase family protein [Nitrososphaera sp.]|uniref:peroxiredoxin family protein n=1 Tax=Nitrososphaera sp. TaxID=1971748 RepID=UPI001807D19E|nr:TlpA disulfide reductase family protein [Nitrososphaera sp.]NWG37605.1 TlpA family protein disulfide reductase [Nitrososphaera sp.]